MIRPLRHEDLPAVAALYAEIIRVDPSRPVPGYVSFFGRVFLDDPELTDPELPTYVYEDGERGVVAVIGSNPRRYLFGEKRLRLACPGPLIVHPDFRPLGIGATLLRRFAAGVQEMSFDDRSVDRVHTMWRMLGANTDGLASIEWTRVLAPVGYATLRLARRATSRATPPGGALVARLSRAGRAAPHPPTVGSSEPLEHGTLIELLERLRRQYPLRPDYTPGYLDSLFEVMAKTVLGDTVVRRVVRDERGRPVGAYVMILAAHGTAHVLNVMVAFQDARLVMDHLFHDAAAHGAVEVAGRCDMAIQAELAGLGCHLRQGEWASVHSTDSTLVGLALTSKALISRMEGEWWMRPNYRKV